MMKKEGILYNTLQNLTRQYPSYCLASKKSSELDLTCIESHNPYRGTLLSTKIYSSSHFSSPLLRLSSTPSPAQKLTPWIRLVMRTAAIVDRHYAVWSFMTKTNGEDLFKNLEKLKPVDFYLPVDMAVRSFRNINDAF